MGYTHIKVPSEGEKITVNEDYSLNVSANPIIPFIEGDGIGVDISPVMLDVVNTAVEKAYGGDRKISWMEVYTGEKAAELYDGDWFPQETLDAIRDYSVAIKGPLTTPVGGGFRSLNVALRQEMDLYVCLRPVRWFKGVPSPVREPEKCDMVIFRENSEDIYAGIEYQANSEEANKVVDFIINEMGATKIRFPQGVGIGIKPVSEQGTKRLVRRAIQYCIDQDLPSVTLVHKGNIMKFTEGAFRDWGYELAMEEFGGELLDGGPLDFHKQSQNRESDRDQGCDCRRHAPANSDPSPGIQCGGHFESERRLSVRRPGRPGRWHRHCAGGQS